LKESGAKPGQWVALPGAGGGLGHLGVQYANAMGLRVLAIDTGKEKEDLCKQLGAEAFVDFKTCKNVIAEVKKITDGGPHAVVVMAASAKPYEDALQMCRTKGTVVAVGLPSKAVMGADVFDTVVRSLTIKGSYVYLVLFEVKLTVGEIVLILRRRSISWLGKRSKSFTRRGDCRNWQRFMRKWKRGKLLVVSFSIHRNSLLELTCLRFDININSCLADILYSCPLLS
jgi:NADPH:quinone reductase-like Zn-dependent oxidoreductase